MFSNNQSHTSMITIGLRGGYFHPVTGYSVPIALRVANLLAENAHKASKDIKTEMDLFHNLWKKHCRFLFILNRMLFGAAEPLERYLVFQHFYKQDQKHGQHPDSALHVQCVTAHLEWHPFIGLLDHA